MSIEQQVRDKHTLEENTRKFLALAASMSSEELEIALGRLADQLIDECDEAEKLHITLKGALLKGYFDLRKRNIKKQNKLKRVAEYLHSDLASPSLDAWHNTCTSARIAWREKRKTMSFLGRIFTEVEIPDFMLPPKPQSPPMPERLIYTVAKCRLLPKGKRPPSDTATDNLLLLAP